MEDWLLARARATPDKIALRIPSFEGITFYQLHMFTERVVVYLRQLKLRQDEHVGVLLPSTLEHVALIFALMRIRCVLVPINARLSSEEINWQLNNTQCKCLITLETYREKIAADTKVPVYLLNLADLPASNGSEDKPDELELDRTFAIVHTSGTSGKPKGAMLTYGNIYHSAIASAFRIGVIPDDRWLCVLPLYHVGGISIIIRSALYGTAVDLLPRFDAQEVEHLVRNEEITLVSLVPTMLYRLFQIKASAWNAKLRLVLLGGAAPSPELITRAIEEHVPIATTYGLTEAASQVATATPEQVIKKPGSVGKALMFTSVRIVNENGASLPSDEYGEVVVSGRTVMRGYYNNDNANSNTVQEGMLHTGDIGRVDADGDLWIIQRRSDLIISGGENIYPVEVENVLREHSAVEEVIVIGVEDPEWGQKVAAVVQLHDGYVVTEEELVRFCQEKLARYKQPRLFRFTTEWPLTASGKINRAEVKTLLK